MPQTESLVRNISDTALWAAMYRARESDRPDALFRDPFARTLAGERGEQIRAGMPMAEETEWAWVMRTYLFDRLIDAQIRAGVDAVINLAAGLDARPYRLNLPQSLQWVEVDLNDTLAYKEQLLLNAKPVCKLERVRLDLRDVVARRELFARIGQGADRVLVLCEGILIYLSDEEASALAADLSAAPNFAHWIHDLASPGLLKMLQATTGQITARGGAPLKFGPAEGPEFFARFGWKPIEVHSLLEAAFEKKRLPKEIETQVTIPEPPGPPGDRPWSGICLYANRTVVLS